MAGGVTPKKGKKGRKVGKGKRKVSHSRYGSYAGVIGASDTRKQARAKARRERLALLREKRKCAACGMTGFHSKRALLRHVSVHVEDARGAEAGGISPLAPNEAAS